MKIKKCISILLVFIISLLSLAGCSVSFRQGVHKRDEDYDRQFNTYYISKDNIEFNVEARIYDESTARDLYDTVLADYNTIQSFLPADTPIKVYVVENTITNEVFVNENNLYCTTTDIANRSYLYGLVSAYLGTMEPWKIYGIYNYIFGDKIDTSSLADYYNDEENMLTLSLFAAFFNTAFSDENTIDIAVKTATSFASYLVEEYGIQAILSCGFSNNYRQEWLNSISVNKNYEMPYDLSWLDQAVYSKSDSYPLVITVQNHIFKLSPLTNETDPMNTPQLVIKVLSDYQVGMTNILSYIEDNAPTQYDKILSRWEDKICYYFDNNIELSYARPYVKEIYILCPSALFHETIHILTHPLVGEYEIWKSEGMAEYLSYFDDTINDRENAAYFKLTADNEQFVGDNRIFIDMLREYYLSKEPCPQSPTDINCFLYCEAIAITTLTHPELKITIATKFGDYYIKLISFDEGVVHYIVSYKKFENYVLEIRLLDYQNLPTVTDTIGNSGLIITISEGSAMAYLVLDKVPADYKICVDGIWYPIPQSKYEHFNNIPPQ